LTRSKGLKIKIKIKMSGDIFKIKLKRIGNIKSTGGCEKGAFLEMA
jgi:hypothetical protein